jgi:hypothetical protein
MSMRLPQASQMQLMRRAVALSAETVREGLGGPFGAAEAKRVFAAWSAKPDKISY